MKYLKAIANFLLGSLLGLVGAGLLLAGIAIAVYLIFVFLGWIVK